MHLPFSYEGALPLQTEYARASLNDVPDAHPVRSFDRYYRIRRGRDGVLDRARLDPLDIPDLMPWLQFFEEEAPDRFRYRLMGTEVVRMIGADFTGDYLGRDISEEVRETRLAEFHAALERGEPVFSTSRLPHRHRDFLIVYRGIFPGRVDGRRLVYLAIAPRGKVIEDDAFSPARAGSATPSP